jgi:hypothetical protein
LKVPRQHPLVLLIDVRLEFRINSKFFILILMEFERLHWSEIQSDIRAKFLMLLFVAPN